MKDKIKNWLREVMVFGWIERDWKMKCFYITIPIRGSMLYLTAFYDEIKCPESWESWKKLSTYQLEMKRRATL